MSQHRRTQLIVALDTASLDDAEQIVRQTAPRGVGIYKVGSQLFTAAGPAAVDMVRRHEAAVFLDLKFHDIPHTVAQAVRSALRLGIAMFTVHAAGGAPMLAEVSKTVAEYVTAAAVAPPLALGVTVLTSMDRPQLNSLGIARSVKNQVLYLGRLCRRQGIPGLVCSGQEIAVLRRVIGPDCVLVVPGVRAVAAGDDQKRIVSPTRAAALGADYIVVGRPIVAAADPGAAAAAVLAELAAGRPRD